MEHFLFNTSKQVDNVWMGARFNTDSGSYEWIHGGTQLIYANWADSRPSKNLSGYCLQLHSNGKWADEPCHKKNVVVCQKRPNISLKYLHKMIANVKHNLVPLGFIYVQHPKERPPTELWHWMQWEDVSAAYEGVFFRVLSQNKSAQFGEVQGDDSPRLTSIHIDQRTMFDRHVENVNLLSITPGTWSEKILTGSEYSRDNDRLLKFFVSNDEVRPRNMAIRIWKRVG